MRWRVMMGAGLVVAGFSATPLSAREEANLLSRMAIRISPDLRKFRAEIKEIDKLLAKLPSPAATNTSHRFGYSSARTTGDDLWIELKFPEPVAADKIVLVPTTTKDTGGLVSGYGFPKRFILEGIAPDGEAQILMNESATDFPNPGNFPVTVDCERGTRLSRLRLTVVEPWELDGFRVLSLSEIMVLSGNTNVAPQARVEALNSRENYPVWSRSNLIDGFTILGLPVLPDSSGKLGWHSDAGNVAEVSKSVTIDLGKKFPLDEVRLIPAWQENMFAWNNYGLPTRFIIEAAMSEDFSDAWTVYNRSEISLQTPGQNIQFYSGNGKSARYVRVTATRLRERTGKFVFALGELEVYSGGVNRALNAKVTAGESLENKEWGKEALTDGYAGGGKLLELPQWFEELEKAHTLRKHRDKIWQASVSKMARTERVILLAGFGGSTATVLIAIGALLRSRYLRIRDRERHRERLARDLHDELGSNLSSIALISAFSGMEDTEPDQMRSDLRSIEQVARESVDSMRDLVGILGGGKRGGNGEDWLTVLRGLAERLLRGMEVEFDFPSAALSEEPNLETRREIYLFCKEVMHNCARHSQATSVRFSLMPVATGLSIIISDNGNGFDPATIKRGNGLGNLRERAAIMHGEMVLETQPGKGATFTLHIPRSKRWTRKRKHK
jgi:signal transduction histidine kinase